MSWGYGCIYRYAPQTAVVVKLAHSLDDPISTSAPLYAALGDITPAGLIQRNALYAAVVMKPAQAPGNPSTTVASFYAAFFDLAPDGIVKRLPR